jgi:membrane protease YdiL (CAAX protease family)
MNQNTATNHFFNAWKKLPVILRALISGFLISTVGVAVWSILLLAIRPPWSIIPMVFVLWVYWKFFSGSWGSSHEAEIRKRNFRAVHLNRRVWKWGLAGAVAFVAVIQSSFVITFRIREFPAAQMTADYKMVDSMPLFAAWAILIMSSVVAGICEETGYRGYLQVPLEKRYGPFPAILTSSLVFTAIHLSKSWASPILPHILVAGVMLGILAYKSGSLIPGIIGHSILDIFDYSVWWTGLTGGFKKQTIFKTGLDAHFVIWMVIFLLSLFIFCKAIRRIQNPH